MPEENFYVQCVCHSPEHTLQFKYYPDNDDPFLGVYVLLLPAPWYRRLWQGLKYIFGYTSVYGYFDEFLLRTKDVGDLIDFLTAVKKRSEE